MNINHTDDYIYIAPVIISIGAVLFSVSNLPETNVEKQPIKDEIEEIAFGYDDDFFLEEN